MFVLLAPLLRAVRAVDWQTHRTGRRVEKEVGVRSFAWWLSPNLYDYTGIAITRHTIATPLTCLSGVFHDLYISSLNRC